jgi:hypothetical protein
MSSPAVPRAVALFLRVWIVMVPWKELGSELYLSACWEKGNLTAVAVEQRMYELPESVM